MKKAISVILCMVMIMGILPFGAITVYANSNSTPKIPSDAYKYNGHYYKIYPDVCATWEDSKLYCENLGGYLAVISSQEENDALYSYITSRGYENAYFGFSDSQDEQNWAWTRPNKTGYTNWHSGEPNNESSTEDYALFYWKFTDGTWNDGNFGEGTDSDDRNFICEWDGIFITSQPKTAYAKLNDTVTASISATGDGLKYE